MKKCERTGNTYHVSDISRTQGGHRGVVPNYKYMCNKQVSYQSSRVLAILWTSLALPSDRALDDKSSTLFEWEPFPPTFTSRPPDVTQLISVSRPSTHFVTLNSTSMYYTECKQKNKNKGGLGMRLTIHIMIYASVHDRSNMIVYFMSCVPDNHKHSWSLYINYHNNLIPYNVAAESAACLWDILVTTAELPQSFEFELQEQVVSKYSYEVNSWEVNQVSDIQSIGHKEGREFDIFRANKINC